METMTSGQLGRVAVVGASLAGLAAARRLAESGKFEKIVVFSAESSTPYDRPPLSKGVLRSENESEMISLLEASDEGAFELKLNSRVDAFDDNNFRLLVGDVWTKPFPGGVVVASGSTPRTWQDAPPGVYTLRTREDAFAIRAEFSKGPRNVVVVGGGFIGAEVAASARILGHEVTVIEVDDIPFARILGETVGARITQTHREHGVEFITGVGVSGLEGTSAVTGVTLADGRVIAADLVVVGIGVLPETDWLRGTSVPLGDGVLCDETLWAAPRVVAAGDIANWPNGLTGERRRVEHWDNAIRQGRHAADRLLAEHGVGQATAFEIMPWVWSDQFEMKLQLAGVTRDADEIIFAHGTVDEGRFVALYRRGDRLAGAFCMNRVKAMMKYRMMLEQKASWSEVMEQLEVVA